MLLNSSTSNWCLFFLASCRGGDDTQRGLNAEPPLESLGAATSNVALHSVQYLRRNSNEGTSMCNIAFAIILDGNT